MRTFTLFVVGAALGVAAASEPVPFRVYGQAWTEAGRIMESSRNQFGSTGDSIDVDGASLQSTGAQIVVDADLSEKLFASFGFGVRQISNSVGVFVQSGSETYSPYGQSFTTFRGYVAQAHLTYAEGGRENPWFSATVGNFSHVYNRNSHNLGGYLLRGPVYPGILLSGFQEFALDTAKATQMGVRIHHKMGAFSHDLLFVNEHDLPPTFDWSLAYIAKVKAGPLEVGAGVNFNRILTYAGALQNVDRYEPDADTLVADSRDTTTYTHSGTKVMAMFSLDVKRLLPEGRFGFGPQDLILYGEAALLGVTNYGELYDNRMERLPVMVGFNVPTFGILDRLAVEAEWYSSPYRNDLYNIGNPNGMVAPWRWNPQRPNPSPIPVVGESTDDDWRWSVLIEKTIASHIRFTGQVASDHYRPLPFSTGLIYQDGGTAAAFLSPKEWYFMARLGFFF